MSSILNIATNGLNNAVTRSVNAASSIVNASSTQKNTNNIDESLVTLKTAQVSYDSNAVVIKAAQKTEKALLDIKA